VLVISEDEAAEARERSARPQRVDRSEDLAGPTRASALLTKQLKGLSTEELREKGDHYKQLLEARDLEDVLYEGGS
jgi:hypothetical protein